MTNQAPKTRVLIVQDNQAVLRDMVALLMPHDYEISTASDGEEGWAVFLKSDPHAVLSAVRMPNLDGLSLLRRIRDRNTNCKVILVSGTANPDTTQQAQSMGATAVLSLPIPDAGTLVQLIEA